MSDRVRYLIAALAIAVGIAVSYALAMAGEPQSAWLWGVQ